jgi:hypothetical protein
MIRKILLVGILFTLIGCEKEESDTKFKYFDFYYNDTFGTCFSIKFTPNDSVYVREHWNYNDAFDSTNVPKGKTNYITLISKKDKTTLIELISKTQLKKYNSSYYDNYSDGISYILYIDKDSIKKSISVHSYKKDVPEDLDSLSRWIYHWKSKVKLIKTNKKLTFISSKYILQPPPPPLPSK